VVNQKLGGKTAKRQARGLDNILGNSVTLLIRRTDNVSSTIQFTLRTVYLFEHSESVLLYHHIAASTYCDGTNCSFCEEPWKEVIRHAFASFRRKSKKMLRSIDFMC
jgi:hypothetical protein